MRKALGLIAALLVLGAAAVGWCAKTIYAAHDQVQFKQTVLAGDPAAADGLTVQAHATYQNQIFWDSEITVQGDAPQTQTDYRFTQTKQKEAAEQTYQGVEIYSMFEQSPMTGEEESQEQLTGIDRLFQELYDSLEPGEQVEKTVPVSEYYDYYPLTGMVDVPGYHDNFGVWRGYGPDDDTSVWETFSDFFRIPVLPEENLSVSLQKYDNGNTSSGVGSGGGDAFPFYTQGVVLPETCYFIFSNRTQAGNLIDTSLIPGGYGIYALDYKSGISEASTDDYDASARVESGGSLQMDSLRMAFPIDPAEEVLQLSKWSDDQTLFLYTKDKNDYFLTIIATDSMQQVQRIKLHTLTDSEPYNFVVYENPDFQVCVVSKTVSVLVPNGDGTFRLDMQTPSTLESLYLPWSVDGIAMAYRNGKLAFANEDYDRNTGVRNAVSFDLVVLDEQGMQLYAKYQSSLQSDSHNTGEKVRFIYNHPLELAWQ